MTTEFSVDTVIHTMDGLIVHGALNLGDIRVGDVFTSAYVTIYSGGPNEITSVIDASQTKNIKLRVVSISTYGHSLNELACGMTGTLMLSGDNVDVLRDGDTISL